MPLRVISPCRNITRRSVITKCVVHQLRNGQIVSHPTRINQTAPMTTATTVLAVGSQSVLVTTAAPKAASAVASRSTRIGPISRFQCGCRCSTTCSSLARTLSG